VKAGKAFTLVELLVVIAIIALLLSILMPNLARAKEIARRARCAGNLHAIGRGWLMYREQYEQKQPRLSYYNNRQSDYHSQFNYLLYFNGRGWCNAGVLYSAGFLTSKDVFICPTVQASSSHEWFGTAGSFSGSYKNVWPPLEGEPVSTRMTYGTRRMTYYDDPALSGDPECKPYEFRHNLANQWAENPTGFSFMADNFSTRSNAMRSHVPGVNVLYFDGHAKFYEDEGGKVLYDNGIGDDWGMAHNWTHDNVWVAIDKGWDEIPPAGSP